LLPFQFIDLPDSIMPYFNFTLYQLSVRVALLFLLIFDSFMWVMADAPPHAATTAPKALTSCRPTFSSGCLTGGLNSFTVNGITLSNATGCSTGYESYTTATTNVTPGQPYPFAGTFTSNSGYPNGVTVWADVNRDGVFEAAEVVYQAPATVTASSFSGSLTIPPNTATGSVDVRVVVAVNTIPAGSGACGTYSYGEAEDYVLNVITPTTYNPSTFNVASTSAVLAWNNLGTASSYDVQWQPTGGTYTTITGITSTSYALTGLTLGTSYEWQMQPTGGSYIGPVSFTTTACATPINLNRFNVGATSVQELSWSSVFEAAYPGKTYEVQLQTTGTSSWSTVYTGANTRTPRVSGLAVQTPYTWRVRADCSVFSAPQTFTTTPCNAPSISGTYNIAHNSARLFWNDPENALYSVQYRPAGGNWTTVSNLTAKSYTLTSLTVNNGYEWAVSKVCTSTLSSPYSATQTFTTVCSPVINPTTDQRLSTSVRLNWSNNGPGIPPADVQVQWRPSSQSAVSWATIDGIPGDIPGGVPTYTLAGLTNNTGYQWQARASCGMGVYSAFSSPVSFTTQSCPEPYFLNKYNVGTNRALLSWSYRSYYAYQTATLQYRPASLSTTNSGWTSVSGIPSTSYSVTGLEPNTTYQWLVNSACTLTEASVFSIPATFTTLPCTNQTYGLSASMLTFGSAQLSWSDDSYSNTYNLQYRPKTTPVSAWNTISNIVRRFDGTYLLTGLSPGTNYEYQVAIACSPTQSSTYSTPYSFSTSDCSNLAMSMQVSGTSFNAATLNWAGPTGVGYTLHYRPVGGSTWADATAPITRPYTLTGLNATTAYEAEVASVCSASQNSAYSIPVSFTTTGCTNSASGLSTFGTTFNATKLDWQGFSSNPFDLRWRPLGSTAWTMVPGIRGRPYTLAGLSPTTAYEWQLAAVCGPGQSSTYTSSNSFMTTAATNLATGLTVTGTVFNAANLDWAGPTSIPYDLRWRPLGSSNWTDISGIIARPYTLTGLSAETAYEWQVATPMSGSAYTGTANFTTIACTNVATSLTTLSVGSTTATLSWTSPPGVGSSLQYRMAGAVSWQTVAGVVNAPYALTGLIAGTAYQFQVASVCGPGQLSGYTGPVSFTTTGTNPCPVMYTVKNGSWDDPTVWICNRVPLVTDAVQIRHNVAIPGSYLAYSLKIGFGVGGKVSYGTGARLVTGQ
jgi:trimeric autotransporter adhesin